MNPVQLRNPKYYENMPPCMTKKIIAAGKSTFMSESVTNLLKGC